MTVEQLVAALQIEGWHVWSLGEGPRHGWSCRLWCRFAPSAGARGSTGFDDTEAWRSGAGPTMLAALSAAAVGITNTKPQEDVLDLAAMLR